MRIPQRQLLRRHGDMHVKPTRDLSVMSASDRGNVCWITSAGAIGVTVEVCGGACKVI